MLCLISDAKWEVSWLIGCTTGYKGITIFLQQKEKKRNAIVDGELATLVTEIQGTRESKRKENKTKKQKGMDRK